MPAGAPSRAIPRIAITPGEPAGIGPELCARLPRGEHAAELVLIADPALLSERAGPGDRVALELPTYDPAAPPPRGEAPPVSCLDVPLNRPSRAGHPDPANAGYVLAALDRACDGCLNGSFDAMVTAPVHKGVINEAGIAFDGHTGYLARRAGAERVVMMLLAPGIRVALVTTHLPLHAVAGAIDRNAVRATIEIVERELRERFDVSAPRIAVCGLNPHAGEGGHLGHEESAIIEPVLTELRRLGMSVTGPLPADTAFTPDRLAACDVVVAMYHDQGLPVLKHMGFGRAVNVTLGLPFVRTSVDHGTAFDLAGTGRASGDSLTAALELAIDLTRRRVVPRGE